MSFENNHSKTGDQTSNRNLYEKQSIITDLVFELTTVTNEKINLDHENVALKLENQKLKQRLEFIELSVQDRLFHCEGHKDVDHLEKQKLSMLEVSNLKLTYRKQRELFEQRQDVLLSQIKQLENKLNQNAQILDELKLKAERNYKKYVSYKKKVKQAIVVIKNLASGGKIERKKGMDFKRGQTNSRVCKKIRRTDLDLEYDVVLRSLFFKNFTLDEVQSILVAAN